MRILNWMQQKLNGGHANKKSASQDARLNNHKAGKGSKCGANSSKRTDLIDWQQRILTIGTLGNSEVDERSKENGKLHENASSPRDGLIEFTLEEVGKIEQELKKYFAVLKHSERAVDQDPQSREGLHKNDFPLNKFLNCPSSLDVDRTSSRRPARESSGENDDPDDHFLVPSMPKNVGSSGTRFSQRSVSFLLKTMFACQGGFGPMPSLRDPASLESRMDKFIRVIFHSRIGPTNATSGKKFIQCKPVAEIDPEEERKSHESEKCKWVKTDSEFIVLEM